MKSIIAAILALLACSAQAQQQPVCGETKEVLKELYTQFKEQPVWMGKSDSGIAYIILANPEEKNWTMLMYTDKVACFVLTGDDYKQIFPGKGAKIRT
jgi:hypothetical protein